MTIPSGIPQLDIDLFSDEVLANSADAYAAVREAGPVAWLSKPGFYAIGGFSDVRDALRATDCLISSKGNWYREDRDPSFARETVLLSDGLRHVELKRQLMKPLTPKALTAIDERLEGEAASAVAKSATGNEVEAVSSLAAHLPVVVVSRLAGFSTLSAEVMLRWAAAGFNWAGPSDHTLARQAGPDMMGLMQFALELAPSGTEPGSWARRLFDAVEAGELSELTARSMMIDYLVPSLDTTILASAELLYNLAVDPDLLPALRKNPSLVSSAVLESVRLASPVRGFGRYVDSDYRVGGLTIPKGSRVALLNAAANRDPRQFAEPDRFVLTRNPRDHLGWGYGPHLCAGMHLAKLEMETLLRQLVAKVERIDLHSSTRIRNLMLQGFETLHMRLLPLGG